MEISFSFLQGNFPFVVMTLFLTSSITEGTLTAVTLNAEAK